MSRDFSGGDKLLHQQNKSAAAEFVYSGRQKNELFYVKWPIIGGSDHYYFFVRGSDRRCTHSKQE